MSRSGRSRRFTRLGQGLVWSPPMTNGGMSLGSGEAVVWSVLGTLLAGPLVWGGVAWLAAARTGAGWLVPLGIVVGSVTSLYIVYARHGRSDQAVHPGDPR